jgi:hypothetical protein
VTSTFAEQRRVHLEELAARLPDHGLAGKMIGNDEPLLWVWHPGTGRQTIVFATQSKSGWQFLWSDGGQEGAGFPDQAADLIKKHLADHP